MRLIRIFDKIERMNFCYKYRSRAFEASASVFYIVKTRRTF